MIHQAVSMQPITPPTTSTIISTKCTALWSVKTFFDKMCFQNLTKERKILLTLLVPGSWTAGHWCFCRLCHCEVNKVTFEAHQASFSIQEISAVIISLNNNTFTCYVSRYSFVRLLIFSVNHLYSLALRGLKHTVRWFGDLSLNI